MIKARASVGGEKGGTREGREGRLAASMKIFKIKTRGEHSCD